MMKQHIGTNLLLVLLGAIALFLAVLCVLSAIPSGGSELTVTEVVRVASSKIDVIVAPNGSDMSVYAVDLSGRVENPTDRTVTVTSLTATVKKGDREETVELLSAPVELPPRTTLPISAHSEGRIAFDRVADLHATVDGKAGKLHNATGLFSFDATALVYLLLLAVDAAFLVHFAKIRYYLFEEDRMKNAGKTAGEAKE